MAKKISKEAIRNRVAKWESIIKEKMEHVNELHVKLMKGNRKTGISVWTVSLTPIIDCKNCKNCMWDCYDAKSDMIYPSVVDSRTTNSAIHKADPKRYWKEIDEQIKQNNAKELRINVGGDLDDNDFKFVADLGVNNPNTRILFFTKNYKGINKFLSENQFPNNVSTIMSAWLDMEMDNPYNLPCSHVLYEDGKTTAPEYGAIYCNGNCTECAIEGNGCWDLNKGEHVIFKAH